MTRRLAPATLLAVLVAVPALLAQNPPPAGVPAKNPLLKLVEPWPEDDVIATRKTEAQARKLFQDSAALEFSLTTDFKALNKERKPDNSKRFPGVLTVDGKEIAVTLSSRGHFRLKPTTCDFVPIKIEFAADQVAGTIFDGQTSLKLGTHCQNAKEYDQYVMRESLTYTFANLVTPFSFRARLARATYVDEKSKKPFSTHHAMFLEHENDVARRMGGRDVAVPQRLFKDLDPSTLTTMMLFEYMLGNADYSIWALHNVVLVQDKRRILYPVPYDFDLTGMVRPPYATPDPRLPIKSITERLYRGPCRTVEEFDASAKQFRDRQTEMFAAIESMKGLDGGHKGEMKDYLESFFRAIQSPESIKRTFVDGCHTNRMRI